MMTWLDLATVVAKEVSHMLLVSKWASTLNYPSPTDLGERLRLIESWVTSQEWERLEHLVLPNSEKVGNGLY